VTNGVADQLGKNRSAHSEIVIGSRTVRSERAEVVVAQHVRRACIGRFELPPQVVLSKIQHHDGDVVARFLVHHRPLDELCRIDRVHDCARPQHLPQRLLAR